jgi:hypothetical protein
LKVIVDDAYFKKIIVCSFYSPLTQERTVS